MGPYGAGRERVSPRCAEKLCRVESSVGAAFWQPLSLWVCRTGCEGVKQRAELLVLHRGDLWEETTPSSRGVSKKWPRH